MGRPEWSARVGTERSSFRRRDILGAAAAIAGAAVVGTGDFASAQSAGRRIDVHHHFFPPAFLDAQRNAAGAPESGQPLWAAITSWSPAKTSRRWIAMASALRSFRSRRPVRGLAMSKSRRRLARQCNDYAAEMTRDHPGRFGLFAALPLPDPDATLREIEYAFDTLKADGVGMMTSYGMAGRDIWPGDASSAPVFAELNRRNAVAFFHLGRVGSSQLAGGNVVPGVPDVMVETPHEMTRTVMSLLFNGTLSRNPNIRFIFTNAGGTVPMLAGRIAVTSQRLGTEFEKLGADGAEYELQEAHLRSFECHESGEPRRARGLRARIANDLRHRFSIRADRNHGARR